MKGILLADLRLCVMNKLKPNFTELGRRYGLDRRTIQKYYNDLVNGIEKVDRRTERSSKLDPYKELIRAKLAMSTSIRAVYQFILAKVDSDIGSYENFRYYVRKHKLQEKIDPEGYPRFETDPGLQAQILRERERIESSEIE